MINDAVGTDGLSQFSKLATPFEKASIPSQNSKGRYEFLCDSLSCQKDELLRCRFRYVAMLQTILLVRLVQRHGIYQWHQYQKSKVFVSLLLAGTTPLPKSSVSFHKMSRDSKRIREKDRANDLQGDFRLDGTRAEEFLHSQVPGGRIDRKQLCRYLQILGLISGVKLPRDYTRRRALLFKWIDDNYDLLSPYMKFITLAPYDPKG